ncbi:hypothetical protein [Modestobacter marinus]|uniref:hypothetical protein n=1 Tax=Modestobacter marinus TaxID=477641 RepID=UPI001C97DE8B|nr:hypothetical protein [Modestobacter marinus]
MTCATAGDMDGAAMIIGMAGRRSARAGCGGRPAATMRAGADDGGGETAQNGTRHGREPVLGRRRSPVRR